MTQRPRLKRTWSQSGGAERRNRENTITAEGFNTLLSAIDRATR